MCGIAGSWLFKKFDFSAKQTLEKTIANLNHRGPDYQMVKDLGKIQLGHARLSILDLNPRSHQPMSSYDERYWIVFNGEIYNFLELKKELINLGYAFITNSDTEVLLNAWHAWGASCLEKLTGMFAFALWDSLKDELFLVRDRMGEKPLFYSYSPDAGILFASELSALREHPLFKNSINFDAINQFLSLNYILGENTIYKNFHKVLPAHYVICKKDSTPQSICYWQLSDYYNKPKLNATLHDAKEQFDVLMQETIQQQIRSDVPLGVFLSGGLDSSTIAASMQHIQPKSFSIGFSEATFSEIQYSQQVADHLAMEHLTQIVSITSPDQISKILSSFDEPFADSSLLPCYYLSEFTRSHVTVALSGDGGDELFAGYPTYLANVYKKYLAFLPTPLTKLLSYAAENYYPASFGKVSFDYKLKQFLKGLSFNYQHAHYSWREIFTPQEKKVLCNSHLIQSFETDPAKEYCKHFEAVKDCELLDQFLYVDMKTWLTDDILVKVDRTSMAHSLEVRVPFLNHKLVEFAAQLPTQFKLKGKKTKYFLKQYQTGKLPTNIIYRKKEGFNSPVSHWLLAPKIKQFAQEILLDTSLKNLFNMPIIQKLYNEHEEQKKDHSYRIFGLLSLSLWLNRNRISI